MTDLLAAYDRADQMLAAALSSRDVVAVKARFDDLDLLKLRAKQIRDRELLVKATEVQMRVERHLGLLLAAAKAAGQFSEGRPSKREKESDNPPVTLEEVGITRALSSRAQRAAGLEDDVFAAAIEVSREKIRSGKAILVDPVQEAIRTHTLDGIRAAHAARTMEGGCVEDLGKLALSGFRAKFIGSDPQWKFLTRSAAGDGRSANVHYKTEEVDKIKNLPVRELAADDSLFGMWMVDWCPQDALDLMAHYGFKHVTTLYTWIKTNGDATDLDLWSDSSFHIGQGYWTRANPEDCWLGTRGNPKRLDAGVRQLIVAPLMEHSRKPDEWLARSERLGEGPFLELQARRSRKGWVSWGDELEFTGVAA